MECARSRAKPWPIFTASFSSGRAKPKAESRKQKSEMNQGRLPEEFRDRTKRFASSTVRLFIALPKDREEVRTLGKQLLRSGTSVAAHTRGAWRTHSDEEFASMNFQRSHLARLCGREPFYRSQFQFSSTVERGWTSCRVVRSLVPPPREESRISWKSGPCCRLKNCRPGLQIGRFMYNTFSCSMLPH